MVSVLINECQHKAETLDGVLSVFVLNELTKENQVNGIDNGYRGTWFPNYPWPADTKAC